MNSIGRIFRIEIFGESHGYSVGVLIDGCPAGISLKGSDLKKDLERRMPVKKGSTSRKETDIPHIRSGIFKGKTTGAPILIEFLNGDARPDDYEKFRDIPRPGHSDLAAMIKYSGFNDLRGGGHFSGRLTTGIVAAGTVAKKILRGVKISAVLKQAGGPGDIEENVMSAASEKDSIGGIIECSIDGLPAGYGEPFFDSVESVISHAVFSVPGVKAIEFGSGFRAASMKGSEYNDKIIDSKGRTSTNNSGGISGGISNGNRIFFRTALRPPSSIGRKQRTLNIKTSVEEDLIISGRHDVCFALRSPVIIEAAAAIALCDIFLIRELIQSRNKN